MENIYIYIYSTLGNKFNNPPNKQKKKQKNKKKTDEVLGDFFSSSWKKIHTSPLRWSLNVPSIASTAEVHAKCILLSFLLFLRSRAFTVAIFGPFFFHFTIIFLPKKQKWSKNGAKNEPKMARKWLLWTTLMAARVWLSFIWIALLEVHTLLVFMGLHSFQKNSIFLILWTCFC